MDEQTLIDILRDYECKLQKYMTVEEYVEFSKAVAKRAFSRSVQRMPDSDFKTFVQDHFTDIVHD